MSPFLLLLLALAASTDLSTLDEAIQNCRRDAVLPVFAAEPTLRSAFLTSALTEQAAISAARLEVANKRRALREAAAQRPPGGTQGPAPTESDAELALQQLALDDRQRALDDRRRLEAMRHDAVNAKREYFLTRCGSSKPKG